MSHTEVRQLILPTTEDREDLASAHRAAQEEEVVQLLHEQQRIVVSTDAVSEDGGEVTVATSAPETERCRGPTSVREAGGAQVETPQPQVRQFNWAPNQALTMMVPVWIGRRKIMAVVDTAAQVTLINRRLSQELGCEDPVERVQLRNAQMDSWMDGGIVQHFGFQLGGRKYFWDVVEADIGDDFIIGIDFLKSVQCKIDLEGNILELGNGDRVQATMKQNGDGQERKVSRVLLHKKTSVPPKTMKFVKATLEHPIDAPFMLEPGDSAPVFAVPVLIEGKGPMQVCVVNLGEQLVSLRRKQEVATAIQVDAMVEPMETVETPEIDSYAVNTVQVESSTAGAEESGKEQEETATDTELPEHVRGLFEECCKRLTAEQARLVRELLIQFADVFATHDLDIGCFTVFAHRIKTGKAFPLRKSMKRTPLGFDQEERKTLKAMLDAKVIEPSQSEWASPPVLVRKRDGTWRYCLDFRGLNAVTARDAYPLPLIEECIDSLADMRWFSTLDMNSGYWQLPVAEEDKEKTAFITKYGLFHFLRMPFGLSNAPATFQRTMNLVLSGLIWVSVIVYLDDVNVIGKTFHENLANLRVVLSRFRKYGLKLKPRKCVLFKRETAFLGRRVDGAGVHVTDDHVRALVEWPEPTRRKQVEQFLGFVNYHRGFIQDLAKITAPLYELTGPKARWKWGDEQAKAFADLKKIMVTAPVLACPRAEDPFILDTDASDFAIGAVLSQLQDGKERPVSFASKVLNSAQRAYCTTRKELLAVVVFTRHFRHYLLGRVFVIRTDHASLVWLMRFKHPCGQLARWLTELAQYAFHIEHRSGTKHCNADGMSRIPEKDTCDCYVAGQRVETLPCGGCDYCQRVHTQWARFEDEVDDVVPITVRDRGSVRKEEGDLDLTYLWEKFTENTSAGVSKGAEVCSGASAHDHTEVPTEQSASQGSALNAGSMQSGAVAHDCERSREGVSSLVRVIQAGGQGEEVPGMDARSSNYMEQYTPRDIREKQLRDPDLQPLFAWLEHSPDHVPAEGQLRMQSPSTLNLWKHRSRLRWHQGVLQYQWDFGPWQSWLLLVPTQLKEEMLRHFHDSATGGHLGVIKTVARLRQRCYWYGMVRDVQVYIATCAECTQNKRVRVNPRAPLQCFQAGNPGERLHLDILGPFLESSHGNRYVLMMVDQFTRWLELQAISIQDAETVARVFFESYTVRFGVPFVIHTDQGRNFDGNFFQAFCDVLDCVKTRTTPYRPSSNGQVERYNQQVLNFLRCFLQGKQRCWDEYLPVLGMALRATVNRSTGFTPNMLQLGREVNMPADVMLNFSQAEQLSQTQAEYLRALLSRMEEVQHQARQHLRQAQVAQKKYYDLRARANKFSEGDLVYKKNMGCKVGLSRKLCPLFVGPYIVKAVLPHDLYRVEGQRKEEVMHHDRLRRCEDRAIPFWVQRKRHGTGLEASQEAAVEGPPSSDLDETVAYGQDLPQDVELALEEEDPEWNLEVFFQEEEERPRGGRVRRRPGYLRDYVE